MKPRRLLVIGLLVFGWFLLMQAPAPTLYAWFAPKSAPVTLYGVEGSLARGQVAAVAFNGQPFVRDVHWRLRPLWLPLLHAAFQLDGGGSALQFSGLLSFTPGGIGFRQVNLDGGIKAILGAAGYGFAPVDGAAHVHLDRAVLRHGFPSAVEGQGELRGLVWTLLKDPLPLGSYRILVHTEADAVTVTVSPESGPLLVEGQARLQSDRSYDYDLRLKPREATDTALQNMLHALGQPDPQGQYHLRGKGRL
jgi:hypothetical protein